ncbi:MAG TPA: DUF6477 family protein [Methyloceanibacter sp.]|nr:DUF6477 family protein [Methyloceanibacter sp.]
MSGEQRRHGPSRSSRGASAAKRMFAGAVVAGAGAYVRSRDLPRLLALWPHELEDQSEAGRQHLLAKLRRALRTERRRARAAHWSYDLNRHLGLLSAYKGELANLGPGRAEQAQPNCTPSAGETGSGWPPG